MDKRKAQNIMMLKNNYHYRNSYTIANRLQLQCDVIKIPSLMKSKERLFMIDKNQLIS